jgi:hypothetical protein
LTVKMSATNAVDTVSDVSIDEIETAINTVLALPYRSPQTITRAVGAHFVEHHKHLVNMMCQPDFGMDRLLAMLELAKKVHVGEKDQNEASEEVGLELAKEYVHVVAEQYSGAT